MAARIDPRHVRARHQSIHHLVANAPWDDAAALRIARGLVLAEMDRHGPVAAWLVDDTAFPKRGQHSVGVAHQYCGPLGKPAKLSGGRDRHVDERSGQRADGLPAVPAGELGAGPERGGEWLGCRWLRLSLRSLGRTVGSPTPAAPGVRGMLDCDLSVTSGAESLP